MTPVEWNDRAAAFERRMVRWAFRQLGVVYIFGGKGNLAFDKVRGLRPWAVGELTTGHKAYDCSGFVLDGAREVTALDFRGRWSAQTMHDGTREFEGKPVIHRTLRFYGTSRTAISHIAIAEESRTPWETPALVLEAAGAGRDAVDEKTGRAKGAEVRHVEDRRGDLVGSVPLWALAVAMGALPNPPAAP